MRRQPCYSFDFGPRVRFRIVRRAITIVLLALAEVDTAGQFTDDGEVHATADGLFERGAGHETFGCKGAGTEVTECGEGFAEGEKTLFGADGTRAPFLFVAECASVGYQFADGVSEERTGPPMAPRMMASADLAAVRASSVSGLPVASMEHCMSSSQHHVPTLRKGSMVILTPPSKCSWKLNFISDLCLSITRRTYPVDDKPAGMTLLEGSGEFTLSASAVTSGPQWSPPKTTMLYVGIVSLLGRKGM